MLIALPLPDEFCRGHVGRISILNGFPNYTKGITGIRQHVSTADACYGESIVTAIAKACKMGTIAYARLHTLMPYLECMTKDVSKSAEARWTENVLTRMGMTAPKKAAFLCSVCVEEDISFWGYSYWRRMHQLPGVLQCHKHGRGLKQIEGWDAFEKLPQHWMASGLDKNQSNLNSMADLPLIRRFSTVSQAFLDMEHPLPQDLMKRSLRFEAACKSINCRTNENNNFRFNQFVRMNCDLAWLNHLFPDLKNLSHSNPFYALDNALSLSSTVTTQTYALAIALFSDNEETALQWISNPGEAQKRPKPQSTQSLIQYFIILEGCAKRIAIKTGKSATAIEDWIRRNRSLINNHPGLISTKLAIARFMAGENMETACTTEGASILLVINYLRLYLPEVIQEPKIKTEKTYKNNELHIFG